MVSHLVSNNAGEGGAQFASRHVLLHQTRDEEVNVLHAAIHGAKLGDLLGSHHIGEVSETRCDT